MSNITAQNILETIKMIEEEKLALTTLLNKIDMRSVKDESELNSIIRRSVKNYLYKKTKKNPMILPIVMVV